MIRLIALLALVLCTPLAASENEDFWAWLAPRFELSALEHEAIDRWEARYRQRATELEVTLTRGGDLLPLIARAVADRGMPLEIALLPVVESQLNPQAVSARGARGLWQILPATAKYLGLRDDWWFDESADPVASTRAALNYLDYLHARFGSWLYTLAAYNAGESRVASALRDSRRGGGSTELWDLPLPAQTLAYVPKLLGLARVLADPQGLELPALSVQPTIVRAETGGPLDVIDISRLSRIGVGEIYRLNPQLRRWTLPPAGPYSVYLPREAFQRLAEALARNGESTPRREWVRHRVQAGDTLGGLAQKYRSRPDLIRKLNRLEGDRLRIDQTLTIAGHSRELPYDTLRAAREGQRVAHAETLVADGLHQVRPGDSLWTIARRHGTSVRQLKALNRLGGNTRLIPGQLIRVGATDGRRRVYYEVRSGDVLSRIAQRYGVSVRDIQRWNQLADTRLWPGMRLELRLDRHST